MGITRFAFRSVNRALSAVGMRLTMIARDFEEYPLNDTVLYRLFRDLAACADKWFKDQECFEVVIFDTEAWVKDFYLSYLKSPFREQIGGSRFNNLLWLSLLSRAFDPTIIIDSGTYTGASAWALSLGAPNSEMWSFDIDLSQLKWRCPGVQYHEQDWSEYAFGVKLGPRTLVYFDDHVDQARRLLEAHERSIGLAIFDDDFPVFPALQMAHEGKAFPKIEFVLSDELRCEKEVAWRSGHHTWRWPVDVAYLDRARDVIAASERLPDTSSITGIRQTPYRVVRVKHRHGVL